MSSGDTVTFPRMAEANQINFAPLLLCSFRFSALLHDMSGSQRLHQIKRDQMWFVKLQLSRNTIELRNFNSSWCAREFATHPS